MDTHLLIIISIMIISGAFGGLLNYMHNFDTADNESKSSLWRKYVLLGIGAALLVPAFLQMISSDLATSEKAGDYLVFFGFCLIAAIFSRRFISSIGERILEAAKKAEVTAEANKKEIRSTQLELTSAKERIEDVKLAVDITNSDARSLTEDVDQPLVELKALANSYVEKTSVPDYSKRVRLKSELGRKMGEIIVRNQLAKEELLENNQSEGMLLALVYSIELRPDPTGLPLLLRISKMAGQLYTKYSILVAIDTLARNSFIRKHNIEEVMQVINGFRKNADTSLLRKIEETINILNVQSGMTKTESYTSLN